MLLVSSVERVVHDAGHAIRFVAMEPKDVPDTLVAACLQAGCFPFEAAEKIVAEPVKRVAKPKTVEKE